MKHLRLQNIHISLILIGFSLSHCGGAGDKNVINSNISGEKTTLDANQPAEIKIEDDEIGIPLPDRENSKPKFSDDVKTSDPGKIGTKPKDDRDATQQAPPPVEKESSVLPPGPVFAEVESQPLPDSCNAIIAATNLPRLTVPRGLPLNELPWTYRIAASEVPEDEFIIFANVSSDKHGTLNESILTTHKTLESGDLIVSFSDYEGNLTIGKNDRKSWSAQKFTFEFRSTEGNGVLKEISSKSFDVLGDEMFVQATGNTLRTTKPIKSTQIVVNDYGIDQITCHSPIANSISWKDTIVAPVKIKIAYPDGRSVAINEYFGELDIVHESLKSLSESTRSGKRFLVSPEASLRRHVNEIAFAIEPNQSAFTLPSLKNIYGMLFDLRSTPSKNNDAGNGSDLKNEARPNIIDDDSFSKFVTNLGAIIAPIGQINLSRPMAQLSWNEVCGGYEHSAPFSVQESFVIFTAKRLVDWIPEKAEIVSEEVVRKNNNIACSESSTFSEKYWKNIQFQSPSLRKVDSHQ